MHRLLALTLLLAVPAFADHPLSMWEVSGGANRVYLLGSIHLLRDSDYPIPEPIYAAYDEAEALYMELDMDDLDPAETQALVAELGLLTGGRTLAQLVGNDRYAEITRLAADIEIPLSMLAPLEPWLAAISVEQLLLTRNGFDPENGIEMHLAARAGTDGKEILGFETMADQLGFLDSLSLEAQSDLLLQSLRDGADIGSMMDAMVRAWRHGDVRYLSENMLSDMQEHAELYDAIVVVRNRNWVAQIEVLLDADDDYLIVVGALHLVGEDGVPAMLRQRGFDVEQMRATN